MHREDLQEVGKRIGRSKAASLAFLEHRLGRLRIPELDRGRLIQFWKGTGARRRRSRHDRNRSGIYQDHSHAAAVHGVVLSVEPIVLARIALARLGLVGQGNERDRRPTQDELDSLLAAFEDQKIPVGRVIRFAVATAMRQDEISRIEWADFDPQKKMLLIRDRKDPRRKSGNSQANPSARHHRLRRLRHHRGATMLCRRESRPDIPVQWKVCWNGVSTPV
ncbi:MAG: tyrosine-type recombinase/integrase, partial [Roseiarcus sp.]